VIVLLVLNLAGIFIFPEYHNPEGYAIRYDRYLIDLLLAIPVIIISILIILKVRKVRKINETKTR